MPLPPLNAVSAELSAAGATDALAWDMLTFLRLVEARGGAVAPAAGSPPSAEDHAFRGACGPAVLGDRGDMTPPECGPRLPRRARPRARVARRSARSRGGGPLPSTIRWLGKTGFADQDPKISWFWRGMAGWPKGRERRSNSGAWIGPPFAGVWRTRSRMPAGSLVHGGKPARPPRPAPCLRCLARIHRRQRGRPDDATATRSSAPASRRRYGPHHLVRHGRLG